MVQAAQALCSRHLLQSNRASRYKNSSYLRNTGKG